MSKFTQRAIDKLNKNLNPHLTQQGVIPTEVEVLKCAFVGSTASPDASLTKAEFIRIMNSGKPIIIEVYRFNSDEELQSVMCLPTVITPDDDGEISESASVTGTSITTGTSGNTITAIYYTSFNFYIDDDTDAVAVGGSSASKTF